MHCTINTDLLTPGALQVLECVRQACVVQDAQQLVLYLNAVVRTSAHGALPRPPARNKMNNKNNRSRLFLPQSRWDSHVKSDYSCTIIQHTLISPNTRHLCLDFHWLRPFHGLLQRHPTPLQVISRQSTGTKQKVRKKRSEPSKRS